MPDNRSFWSGTVAFGLVSLPVHLFTANRSNRVGLRMLDKDGTPLARRYFCSKENILLNRDDLIRGYEVEKNKYIEITDEELDALEPEKSREIDLRRFVPLDTLDPTFFERAYFLMPEEGSLKAYRLLARTMEETGRAGVATVVMRGKEYLIAILAENGILRAETLRFFDELRTPADVGLPELEKPTAKDVKTFSAQIKSLSKKTISQKELTDEASKRLLDLVEQKLEAEEDVIHGAEEPDESEDDDNSNVVDLMQVLKQSLQSTNEKAAKPKAASKRDVDANMSKAELYQTAQKLKIEGRSQMSKEELIEAIKST